MILRLPSSVFKTLHYRTIFLLWAKFTLQATSEAKHVVEGSPLCSSLCQMRQNLLHNNFYYTSTTDHTSSTSNTFLHNSPAILKNSSAILKYSSAILKYSSTISKNSSAIFKNSSAILKNSSAILKRDSHLHRHQNGFPWRSKRTILRQALQKSLSTTVFPPDGYGTPKEPPERKVERGPSSTNDASSKPTSEAMFLGSIHIKSYQRIINASLQNVGSTPSPGKVSATDPYIDPITPRRVVGYTGVTAILSCFVNNLGQRSVSWVRHRDIHVLTVGRFTFTNDDRFQSHHEDGSNEWVLRLRSPQPSDSGYYECQVNSEPLLTRLVALKVVGSRAVFSSGVQNLQETTEPRAVLSSGIRNLFVQPGSTVELNCTVRDAPSSPDFLLWYHNKKVMNYEKDRISIASSSDGPNGTEGASVLRIASAKRSDSGIYTCCPSGASNASITLHIINGEHPAAMQTNSAKVALCHFSFLALALFLGRYLMMEIPPVNLLTLSMAS